MQSSEVRCTGHLQKGCTCEKLELIARVVKKGRADSGVRQRMDACKAAPAKALGCQSKVQYREVKRHAQENRHTHHAAK